MNAVVRSGAGRIFARRPSGRPLGAEAGSDPAWRFLLPGFAGLSLFFLWPFVLSLGYAFLDKPVNGSFVGIANFVDLFQNKTYLLALKNTLVFMGMCLPCGIVFSLAAALAIRRVDKYKSLFTLVFLIPLVIPSGSMVFFWKALFAEDGALNGTLSLFGMPTVDFLGTGAARFVILIIFLWKNLGYNMVLFLAGLYSIPKEYEEAATMDGSGPVRIFFHVILPGLFPMLALVTIMSVINSFKVFKEVYLLTGRYPHESIYMLQHFMNNMFYSLNYQKLTTATCVLVLAVALFSMVLLRVERRVGP